MKTKLKILLPVCLLFICSTAPVTRASAQDVIIEAIKQAAIKVIKAIDLQIQRLQNKTIDLQNVQKQIENTLSKLKLQEIADWTQKQKQLYQDYFDELWKVKSIIAYYRRITEIIEGEKQLVAEYKRAFALIQNDKHFTPDEIEYIKGVYSGIIAKSVESIDQILVLLQSFTVQMSDAERLELLNRSADEIETYISDLRRFTNQNTRLSLQRAKTLEEINSIKKLYGIE
jgi:hypothetical protein